MPQLTIDNQNVTVPPGTTLLEAARAAGIEIPTLCHLQGCAPSTSCMVCVVKVKNPDRLVASCTARAEDGMQIESETDEVRQARRTAIELLLGDHQGDCIGPCQSVCPAHLDIPRMLRQTRAGDTAAAAATARAALVLPATLGRICLAPCEKGCRRATVDEAIAIRLSHRRAGDAALAAAKPALPPREAATGKHVAVIGAGPTGLAAAWRLLQAGHGVAVFDDHDQPGGQLRYGVPESKLPRTVLDAEIALVHQLGAEFRLGVRVGRDVSVADLVRDFDAVLAACGALAEGDAAALGLPATVHGLATDKHTFATPTAGVFAGGDAVQAHRMAVRAVADGRAAAESILRFLDARPLAAAPKPFTTRLGRLAPEEMTSLAAGASKDARTVPAGGDATGLSPDESVREAARCLHCDCRKADDCRLRRWGAALEALPHRFQGTRRPFELRLDHPHVVYEPGKCIACGLCIQVAAREGEPLGLAFIGRGFSVKVDVPFGETLDAGLRRAAAACVAACPTGALAMRD